MNQLPTFLTFHQRHQQQPFQQQHDLPYELRQQQRHLPEMQRGMKKSATSTGFSRRRLLPLRPDFPPTPEEPPEYGE